MEESIQTQINDLNSKMDKILDHIQEQKSRTMATDDLMDDLSIVGKDIYDTTVEELDKQHVEIDPDDLKKLIIKALRNINTFTQLLDSLESITDLINDASPLVTETIIDFSRYLQKLNENGTLETSGAILKSLMDILEKTDKETIKRIGDNGDIIASILDNLSDRELLKQTDIMLNAISKTSKEEIKPVSPLKLVIGSKRKELKEVTGFMLQLKSNINAKNK
ncbi:MAG: hypothetical protein R6V32_02375 [Bacteroidales bacterium]